MSIPDPNLYPIIITTIFSRILQLYYEPKNNEKKNEKEEEQVDRKQKREP